ncbi:cytochrome c biogenesis protein [Effusibacillus lacus]|uniref:Heme exporter protein C n=1 Tax=Effusibacillus lacus TaxID=1348429 RepID=A0A292YSD2_9BACL|nr:cytochrome c biogenesis protein CcsA [Effusibacillus lacus]TCS76108.1 heme exporter protein C [Effusibacillus lacus]GAX91380.1 cytochrome c assembly protein [Effusibacillus lacus]
MKSMIHKVLGAASFVLISISLYLVFIWSPVEKVMGPVQKIFYFHVASAWNAFLAFAVVFVCSIAFLVTRKRTYDTIAYVSAEIGVLFTTIVLITGPIWGRSSWNTWWSWEPRLTTTLILWFIYLAYLMVRKMDGAWDKKARLSAVFGIIGFVDVPIVFMAIRWWRTKFHPIVFGEGVDQKGGGIAPEMLFTLIFCVVSLTVLYTFLLQRGVTLESMRIRVDAIKQKLRSGISV